MGISGLAKRTAPPTRPASPADNLKVTEQKWFMPNGLIGTKPGTAPFSKKYYGQISPKSANQTGKVQTAAHLAQVIDAGYNAGAFGPVSIVPVKVREGGKVTKAYLMTISGTEAVSGQATGWLTNLKAGFGQSSAGLRNARAAINATVPVGARLIIAGHSQGGMIAQQLAVDPVVRAKVRVTDIVTFGSPKVALGNSAAVRSALKDTQVSMFEASGDPTPFVGPPAPPALRTLLAARKRIDIGTSFDAKKDGPLYGIQTHSNEYNSEKNKELAQYNPLASKRSESKLSLEFNPKERMFFSSAVKPFDPAKTPPKFWK
jgi:Lipase (class 3)